MPVCGDILHFRVDEVAIPELAIDGKVEHGEVTRSPLRLELRSDSPNVLGSERRFRANQLAFVPRLATEARGEDSSDSCMAVLLCC